MDQRIAAAPASATARPLFADADLQAAFDRDGYVVVPLLSPAEVAELRSAFLRLLPETGYGSHYTSQSDDIEYRRAVFATIAAAFAPALSQLLDRYRPVVANFFAKEPAPGTSMVVHQDWAFVDERRSRSVNVWCPLEDATVENGTLHVLPGSHRVFDNLRGTAAHSSGLPSPFAGIEDHATQRHLVPVPVPAGSAILNDHRLVHSSPDNRSDSLRVAASLTLVPAEEQLRHYFGRTGDEVDVYEIDDSVLCDHVIGHPPRGRVVGTIPYARPPLTADQLDRLLAGAASADASDPSEPTVGAGRGWWRAVRRRSSRSR